MGSIRTLICNRQELKPYLKPKFYALICSLDPVYPLSCLSFTLAEILQQYKGRRHAYVKGKTELRPLSFCFFTLGLLEERVFMGSCISLPQVFSQEWSLGRPCLNCTSSLFIFPVPHLHSHAAMQAGRGVEGNAIDSCCPGAPGSASSAKPLRRLENFLKLFPLACSSTSIYQRLCLPASLLSRSWQSPCVTVPSHFLEYIRFGRREHRGLMSEGFLDESKCESESQEMKGSS